MGTLTAGQPRLDSYCDHKLPTSCRLSSIGECCACYDERQHTSSYSTYIDGIGYVSRGTRWQRYCWFCKEFWANRVEAAGLDPRQTRIPEVPDQAPFLARWYEFHQGFRVVTREDGSEERIAVLGEDLRDVAPGCLPRTLEELRAGRERSEIEEVEREQARLQLLAAQEETTERGPSLEETLDELFLNAVTEDSRTQQDHTDQPVATQVAQQATEVGQRLGVPANIHAQSIVPSASRNREYQARRVAALRRELQRMRSGIERVISGLREEGVLNVPDSTDAANRLSDLGRSLDAIPTISTRDPAQQVVDSVNVSITSTTSPPTERGIANIQARVDEARQHAEEAQRARNQAAAELDLADEELRTSRARLSQLRNEQRTTENYIRLFGSREEVVAQGENYESPIGGMFSRAMERFQAAEEVRREEQLLRQYLADEEQAGGENASLLLASLEQQQTDVWGVPQNALRQTEGTQYTNPAWQTSRLARASQTADHNYEAGLQQYYTLLRRQNWSQEHAEADTDRGGADLVNGLAADDVSRNLRSVRNEAASQARSAESLRTVVAVPPGAQLDADPLMNNDRGLDAVFILSALHDNENLRSLLPTNGENALLDADRPSILRLLRAVRENSLSAEDRDSIQNIVQDEELIWRSGLPAERNRRRRERGEIVGFSPLARELAEDRQPIVHDIEVMAEAYQMSVQIRRLSGLNAPDQLRMLYRLQRGERNETTRAILTNMLSNDATQSRAREVHEQQFSEMEGDQSTRHAALERERRDAARQGDHSRTELDAQRRATHSIALAAGQLAMRTSAATLLERMANRDDETRAAYQRLQDNGFVPPRSMTTRQFREATVYQPLSGDDDTMGDSDDEGKGLDAPDTGRPQEPMTDEQMTVKLDCQVCYSQLAIIAMLPCGHLTMCQWCSDQHSPTMTHDRTRPRRAAACPVCRKGIRQKVKVFRS